MWPVTSHVCVCPHKKMDVTDTHDPMTQCGVALIRQANKDLIWKTGIDLIWKMGPQVIPVHVKMGPQVIPVHVKMRPQVIPVHVISFRLD